MEISKHCLGMVRQDRTAARFHRYELDCCIGVISDMLKEAEKKFILQKTLDKPENVML